MTGQRVLEIEQAEMRDPFPALDQHDVLGMIVAQDRHRAEAVVRDRLEHLGPGGAIALAVDLEPDRRAIPVGEQRQLLEPLIEAVRLEARHRRMAVKMDEHIGRELVQLALAIRVSVERLAQPRAAEIAEQQQPLVEIAGKDVRRAQATRRPAIRQPR